MPRSFSRVALVLLLGGCGGAPTVAQRDAALPETAAPDAPLEPDATAENEAAVTDAEEVALGADVADEGAPVVDALDASPLDVSTLDASPLDASTLDVADVATDTPAGETGSVALCPVRDLRELYPGFLPTNPYAPRPAATPCVAAAHDVIIVLGCPNNANGTPASCQTQRADMAVALSRAGFGDRFITSGAAVHNSYVEADTLAGLLVARGISSDRIVREPRARHTDENVYYSSLIMQERGWTTALVVSEDPGHLIMTAVCDANCCVKLGRLTVFDFTVAGRAMIAGHYVLAPPATAAMPAECAQIQQPIKLMCTNLSSRNACAGRLRL